MKQPRVVARLLLSLSLALAGATGVTGCKKDQSTTGDVAQAAQGGFAEGYNKLNNGPRKLLKDYFGAIDEATGPTEKYRGMGGAFTVERDITDAKKSFAEAKAATPASMKDMPPLADAALAGAEKVWAVYAEIAKYNEAENFKDDKFEKGKKLHADMIAARDVFNTAIDKFSAALDAVENVQSEAELKKQKPDTMGYWFRFANMEAKKFIGQITKPEDVAGVKAAVKAGFPAWDKVAQDVAAFPAGKASTGVFKSYADAVARFAATATKLNRNVDDPKTDADDVSSAIASLISDYNSLVSLHNTLIEAEAGGYLK